MQSQLATWQCRSQLPGTPQVWFYKIRLDIHQVQLVNLLKMFGHLLLLPKRK
jgi:hypothetical protein